MENYAVPSQDDELPESEMSYGPGTNDIFVLFNQKVEYNDLLWLTISIPTPKDRLC